MRIFVDTEWLDMPVQPVTFHWSNVRFSDVLADAFSTDIELPLSDKNIRLLDVWGLRDRPGQPFGISKRCQIVTNRGTRGGVIRVSRIAASITATVFFNSVAAVMRNRIIDIVQDNSATIVDWQAQEVEDTGNVHEVNISGYDYGIDMYSSPDALFYPNIKVNYLLSLISTATGVDIEPTDGDLRLLCTKRLLCPQNTRQNVLYGSPANNPTLTDGTIKTYGQHIASERKDEQIRFNRAASVHLVIECHGEGILYGGTGTAEVQISDDGGTTWSVIYTATVANDEVVSGTYDANVDDGWLLRVQGSGTAVVGKVETFIDMTFSDYAITTEDYSRPMDFINEAVPQWLISRHDMCCYMFYGAICNLHEMTVKELLSGLMWMTGKKIVADAVSVNWADPDETEDIDATIKATSFRSDKFGQRNIFQSADDKERLAWTIDNPQLEVEKILNKSLFVKVVDVQSFYGVFARVVQYEWALKDDGTAELKVVELKAPALMRCETYSLRAIIAVNTLGLRTLTRTIEIEAVTDAEVSRLDYVRIDGHKYMVEEGDTDETSGLTTFKALLI